MSKKLNRNEMCIEQTFPGLTDMVKKKKKKQHLKVLTSTAHTMTKTKTKMFHSGAIGLFSDTITRV